MVSVLILFARETNYTKNNLNVKIQSVNLNLTMPDQDHNY